MPEKMMKSKIIFILALFWFVSTPTFAQNQSPVVTNVTFPQRSDLSLIVDIYYDVNDVDGDLMNVSMQVSNDNGATWNFTCNSISGDVGPNISSGTQKHIEWDFKTEHPETFGDQFKIKIIADDGGVIMGVPCPGTPTVTYEGKTYNTVQIGDQCWLKENLDVGTRIDGILDPSDNGVIEKYCYDDNPINCETYGGLYQWDEVMQYTTIEGTQGICPDGWHIPIYAEFQSLIYYVDSSSNALKEIGQGTGGGAGTNTSGFSALLVGFYDYFDDYYWAEGISTCFWSSTSWNGLTFDGHNDLIYLGDGLTSSAFSVRCIKDQESSELSCPGIPTVTYEGKTYNTVQIGDQCWLKENLDVGTRIDGIQISSDDGIIEKYCYDDNPANCETYGGLYQWNEAMQYVTNEGAQGICPDGWHIPTLSEFTTLKNFVANDGNALKELGQGTGTNSSGLSGLLAGNRDYDGSFDALSFHTWFWSSTNYLEPNTYYLNLYFNDSNIYLAFNDRILGYSIRCLKN